MKNAATTLLLTGLLIGGFAGPTEAQDPAAFGGEVDVTEVLLDVLVTDKKGNVIVGLTPEDFVIEEDGEPIEVREVTFYSNRPLLQAPGQAADSDLAPQNRYFVLFFEEQQRLNGDNPGLRLLQRQMQAARESRRWIEKEMLLDDYVAIVSYDVKLKVHQDFTQNKDLLLKAVEGAVTGKDPGANWPSRLPQGDAAAVSLRTHLPKGNALRDETATIYEALQVLADATAPIVGRKNLIMFSSGIGEVGAFGLYEEDRRYFPPTVHQLNDANVAVYSVDVLPPEFQHQRANGLHALSDETGGRFYDRVNNFMVPLRKVADENSGYYLVAYRALHPSGESGFQKVSVTTRNPEFRVRAREGYVIGD